MVLRFDPASNAPDIIECVAGALENSAGAS
jgi:hypothetical protein